jgi:outer membrane protein
MYRVLVVFFIFLLSAGLAVAQDSPVLSLEDCIEIALKGNATIQNAVYSNESFAEDVTSSYSGILPSANLSASSGRYKQGKKPGDFADVTVGIDSTTGNAIVERRFFSQPGFTVNTNRFGISVNQKIFDGGEWWNAIRYAKSEKNVSDLNLKNTINSTIQLVHERFFDLLKQQKLLEVNELAVQRSKDQLEKTEKMFELGAVAKVDVFRSKVNYGNDRIQLLTQQNAVLAAKNQLNIALGRDPQHPVEIKADLALGLPEKGVAALVDMAYSNNPDLHSAEQSIMSRDLNVSRSYGILYPNLTAYFNYDRSNEQLKEVYSNYEFNYGMSYGLSLSLNLFNGFRDKVTIQKAKLAHRTAQINFEEKKRQLKASIVRLVDNFNSYIEIININEENLEAAREEYRLAEERYRIGSGTQLEVREAQVNLTRAEQSLVAARYNARITQAQVENALGLIYTKN